MVTDCIPKTWGKCSVGDRPAEPTLSTAARPELTHEQVCDLFSYDANSGRLNRFRWDRRRPRSEKTLKGLYRRIRIGDHCYAEHRVIWLHQTGAHPEGELDHINGNPLDNRIENLRDVSRSVNMQNQRRAFRTSKTGLLGCFPFGDKFAAQITVDGKVRHLGLFADAHDGHAAYIEAKRALHEGCTI